MKTFLLNVWFYAAFAVFITGDLFVFFGALLFDWLALPRRAVVRRLRLRVQRFGRQVVWLLRPVAPVVREGQGWAEPPQGGRVYVCNHRSFSDPWLIGQLPLAETVQIVNRWPFKIPVLGLVARMSGYLNVKQMTLEQFVEAGSRMLGEGIQLVSFPEGTRSPSGKVGVFHGEIFRLVKRTGVPVVPLVFSGNQRTPLKGSMVLRPSVIRMRLLPPLTEAEYKDWTVFRLKETVRERIRCAVQEMEGADSADFDLTTNHTNHHEQENSKNVRDGSWLKNERDVSCLK